MSEKLNPESLRVEYRDIASVVLISKDRKVLLGRKDPSKGGVFPDAWHLPGGGKKEDEKLPQAAIREVSQETGLDISNDELKPLPDGQGESEKTLASGERVWCKMKFYRFEVCLNKTAEELASELKPGGDLIKLGLFDNDELKTLQQVPGGAEFMIDQGYITAA